MKYKVKIRVLNKLRSKGGLWVNITPSVRVLLECSERRKEFALRHNSKSPSKMMYNYTSVYFEWLIYGLVVTIGKQ